MTDCGKRAPCSLSVARAEGGRGFAVSPAGMFLLIATSAFIPCSTAAVVQTELGWAGELLLLVRCSRDAWHSMPAVYSLAFKNEFVPLVAGSPLIAERYVRCDVLPVVGLCCGTAARPTKSV